MHRSFIGARTARATSLVVAVVLAAAMPAAVLGGVGPSNDNFANATVIVGNLPYSNSTNAAGASREGAEEDSTCGSSQQSVWWRFTPVGSGTYRVDTIGSDYNTNVDIYQGTTLANLDEVDCNDDIDSNNSDLYDSRIAFRATGGTRYYFRVSSNNPGDASQVTLSLRSVQPPGNDQYKNATGIFSLPFDANADNTNATSQSNEPRESTCNFARATRWYKYTPSVNTVIWANTFLPVDFDTTLAVYTGKKIANASLVICNDDQWGNGADLYASGVTFMAHAGTTYRFQVAGYDGQSGANKELPFHVRQITPEVNDNFANAMNAGSTPFEDVVNLRRTTQESSEPTDSCSSEAYNTAWYKHTAGAEPGLEARVQDDTSDAEVAVYQATGPGFGGLSLISCSSTVDFVPVSGQTYYFQVTLPRGLTDPVDFSLIETI